MTYQHIFREGKSPQSPVYILLHGTGGDEYDLLPLAEEIAPDVAVLSLRGRRSENGMNRFFNRFPDGTIDVADMIAETESLYQFLKDFGGKHAFGERKIIAMGYSNGANMIVSHFHHPQPIFDGALLFHARDYRPDEKLSDLQGVPLFISAGRHDPWVSEEQANKMIEKFRGYGADITEHWSEFGHQLTDEEIAAAKKWGQSFTEEAVEIKNLLKEINRLARTSRERALTQEELAAQRALREQYLTIFRSGFRHRLQSIKLFDKQGRDVTPHKVKAIQNNLDKIKDEQLAQKLTDKMKKVDTMNTLLGLHHVSLVTSSAKKNLAFYTKVLGMRLVKKTVNQDDITVYHLYYADRKGTPGTTLTFFEFPGTAATRKGTNSIARVSLRVPNDRSLEFWSGRFDELNIAHSEIGTSFGRKFLDFEDFDGTPLRLVSDEQDNGVSGGIPWEKGAIPLEHAIIGLGPVTLRVSRLEMMQSFLQNVLQFREADHENGLFLYEVGEGGNGARIIVQEDTDHMPEQPGYGSVHHIAWRVANREALDEWIERINQTGLPNSGFVDRYYFRSLYVRENNRILFEFATDDPGFASDDETEETLGQILALPPFLEGKRAFIEQNLEPIG